jgi:hypothetical protein
VVGHWQSDVDNDDHTIQLCRANTAGGKKNMLMLRGLASERGQEGHHTSPAEASRM